MSYWLEDAEGYAGDFASTGGIGEMLALPEKDFPALHEFLEDGIAGEDLMERVAKETEGVAAFNYLARLMRAAHAPVMITDGFTDEGEESEDDEPLNEADKEEKSVIKKPDLAAVHASSVSKRKKHYALFESKYNKVLSKFRASTLAKLEDVYPSKAVTKEHSIVDIVFDQSAFGQALFAELSPPTLSVLQLAGNEMMKELGLDDPWKNPPKAAQQFLQRRKQSVVRVGETARYQLNTALMAGTEAGETTMEIADRIRGVFNDLSKGQAQTVATTEVNAAYSDARHDAMKDAGIEYKSWLAPYMPGRDTHKDAQEYYMANPIPIDEPFIVDGEELMHPCDEKGSAKNVINCHCIQLAVKSISKSHFNVYGIGEIRLR